LHQMAPSLGILLSAHVFVFAFAKEKISQILLKVNGLTRRNPLSKEEKFCQKRQLTCP